MNFRRTNLVVVLMLAMVAPLASAQVANAQAKGGAVNPAAKAIAMAAALPPYDVVSIHQNKTGSGNFSFDTTDDGIVAVREDVGRHNALDKLTGAVIADAMPAAAGAVLLTSRVSVEMVQKAASLGAPILVAVSAPTALALRAAESAGITLIAVARHDGFETFTHPHRVV